MPSERPGSLTQTRRAFILVSQFVLSLKFGYGIVNRVTLSASPEYVFEVRYGATKVTNPQQKHGASLPEHATLVTIAGHAVCML